MSNENEDERKWTQFEDISPDLKELLDTVLASHAVLIDLLDNAYRYDEPFVFDDIDRKCYEEADRIASVWENEDKLIQVTIRNEDSE